MSVSDDQARMLRELFASIDAKDAAGFTGFLTDSAAFRFGSSPQVHGRGAIAAAVDGFFDTIAGLRHEVQRTLGAAGVLVCEGEVTYTRHDNSVVTLPFTDVFELDGELISNYKIYMDIGPLYAEQQA